MLGGMLKETAMLQIVWSQFLLQIAELAAWIFLAAAVYALIEGHFDRRNPDQTSDR
jgi:hypothetical protein